MDRPKRLVIEKPNFEYDNSSMLVQSLSRHVYITATRAKSNDFVKLIQVGTGTHLPVP